MDKSKLTRDYTSQPLAYKEHPNDLDLVYLYTDCLWSTEKIANYFNKAPATIRVQLKRLNLSRTQEERYKVRKQTNISRFGVENAMSLPEIKEKIKQINLKKYGTVCSLQNHDVKQKAKLTCLQKYGVENPFASEKIKEKIKQTNLQKFGVINPAQSKEIKQKIKQTNLNRYGVENPSYSPKIKLKISKINSSEKIQLKSNNTKIKNKSFNTSAPEQLIYEQLSKKFITKRQYRSNQYPFFCDFYIPEIDLYIEFQGLWIHGGIPYIQNTLKCQEKLKIWEEKAKTSKFYKNAIKVWTVTDVQKRKIAKKNKLNWIEFFTIEEFKSWFSTL